MNVSSGNRLGLLAKLDVKQVQYLLHVIAQSTLHGTRFIEQAFVEQARNFVATCEFLQDVAWVTERDGVLSLTNAGTIASALSASDEQIRTHLIETLSHGVNPYQRDVADYLSHFTLIDTQLAYQPSVSERSKQSPVRDFLMDLHVVTYRATDNTYLIEPHAADLYFWATIYRSPSRKEVEANAARQSKLGFEAEITVFGYEKDRVGSHWMHRVEHVSLESPFACYDIRSVTLDGGIPTERYIEVKAVSAESYQFYWPRGELNAAKLLRSKYFLYLLPVSGVGKFDVDQMLVISDPYKSIYQNPNAWILDQDVVICTKRADLDQIDEFTSSLED